MDSTLLFILAMVALLTQSLYVLLALFGPGVKYKVVQPPDDLESNEFITVLEALGDAKLHEQSKVEVLTNGEEYYPAELEAIRGAKKFVHLEAYIFQEGRVTQQFVSALAERARAGVQVRMVIDAVGSFSTSRKFMKELTDAGGDVRFYHALRWDNFFRFNNRTHRELLIIDGEYGFMGGSGWADHWLLSKKNHPRWRDTMVRVHGDTVNSMQGTFAENWLECSGEVLAGKEFYPACKSPQARSKTLVINSSPTTNASTRARVLYQTLLASAQESICITTPYFLPDKSARKVLVNAIQRGITVRILVPGKKSDHMLTRSSSRRLYGELLKAGAELYEYTPAMIHAKILVVDGIWNVVGSTNFDHRSFGINDEVNLVTKDETMSAHLREDFENDLKESTRITYEQWRHRSLYERFHECLGWALEHEQ